ncbi:hypothetical protein C5167_001743 [Papaver somniferum]|uniref:Uncharacterized protein n=1 Tax=Papaver somniferum TaxID=3469 RepID=A0A4Y7KW91_PAPSO|nr:protein transport protein Sec24-like At3g07100 [Papaver somniferum]RZC77573.1 hypothetical protein C5167_001743 [Papaver somniferum]
MQPAVNDNRGTPNFPGRPTASSFPVASQATMPFQPSQPVIGVENSSYISGPPVRFNSPVMPPPPAQHNPSVQPSLPQQGLPFVGEQVRPPPFPGQHNPSIQPSNPQQDLPFVGQQVRPPPFPGQHNPSIQPSNPQQGLPFVGQQVRPPPFPGQHNPSIQPSNPQQGLPFVGQQVWPPPFPSPAQHNPSVQPSNPHQGLPPFPFCPQSQISQVAPVPRSVNPPPSQGDAPQSPSQSSFYSLNPPVQTVSQGYPYISQANSVPPVPPVQSYPFPSQQGDHRPAPSQASSMGMHYMGHMQHSSAGPSAVQDLVEDFSSLSVGSFPGSNDPGIDSKMLPRPLDDADTQGKSSTEFYPFNCHPRYLRLTTNAIPNAQSLLSRWHLPLGAVVHPLAESADEEEVPTVYLGPIGIVRCRKCRTYVNPYVQFSEGGRNWRCNICNLLNEVPADYFSPLDANGKRVDAEHRAELSKGTVDFIAPTEYMVRPPMPPTYFFLIDVSISAVKSGMIEIVAETIKSCLDELPGFPRTRIGFITFDSALHFYNMKSSLTQPQMMVVSDLDDIFLPLPDELVVNLSESRTVVDAFLDSLPCMFQDNLNVESAFGPALKAAAMVMSQLGGKLLIFQTALPSLGVGRLRLRGDDIRIYGTEKEQELRKPEDTFFRKMAADLTQSQIGVNVYAFSDKYIDIASLGTLAKYTGGQVYHYPSFTWALHKEKVRHELLRDLTRETAWEAMLRIRCGKGVRFTSYQGHFMLRSSNLLALPAVDCDKAFTMQLALEETLLTAQTVYFQVALLYTTSSGERRIRVHTAAVPVVSDLGEMYRRADIGATISLLSRLAIETSLSNKLEEACRSVQQRIVKALREYRNLYSVQHRVGGRMIYPDSLKFLPLYGLTLCRSLALRGVNIDAQLDDRCAAGYTIMTLPIKKLLKFLYPSLIRIDEYILKALANSDGSRNHFKMLPLSVESLDPSGLYIYDDGFRFVIWFGSRLSSDLVSKLLGVDFSTLTDLSKVSLCEHDNDASKNLMGIIKRFRVASSSSYQLCHLVRQGEQPREGSLLLANLVEDQTYGANNGYVEWIQQIHQQIQQNL